MTSETIRPFSADDELAASALLEVELGGRHQARLGELHDVLSMPGCCAWVTDELVGIATYSVADERGELAALAVAEPHRGRGIGGALIEAVADLVSRQSIAQLWLVTTNDNLDALRLYQRHGFRLTALHPGGVDRARAVKPSIPMVGHFGIPLRDELVLVRPLRDDQHALAADDARR